MPGQPSQPPDQARDLQDARLVPPTPRCHPGPSLGDQPSTAPQASARLSWWLLLALPWEGWQPSGRWDVMFPPKGRRGRPAGRAGARGRTGGRGEASPTLGPPAGPRGSQPLQVTDTCTRRGDASRTLRALHSRTGLHSPGHHHPHPAHMVLPPDTAMLPRPPAARTPRTAASLLSAGGPSLLSPLYTPPGLGDQAGRVGPPPTGLGTGMATVPANAGVSAQAVPPAQVQAPQLEALHVRSHMSGSSPGRRQHNRPALGAACDPGGLPGNAPQDSQACLHSTYGSEGPCTCSPPPGAGRAPPTPLEGGPGPAFRPRFSQVCALPPSPGLRATTPEPGFSHPHLPSLGTALGCSTVWGAPG